MQAGSRALLPHLSRTATHISKLVVPEVGLVTLQQLYCKVTVLSIALLQEGHTVLDWTHLLPKNAPADQMLLAQKQGEVRDESLMRTPVIPSFPHPFLFSYNSVTVFL